MLHVVWHMTAPQEHHYAIDRAVDRDMDCYNIIATFLFSPKSRVVYDDTKTAVLVAHYSCSPLSLMII